MKRAHVKPRYLQVADELIAQIRAGKVAVGSLLPTEIELCRHYRISRHTAREALRVLSQMGLVDRRRGSGTRVLARHSPVQYRQFVQTIDDLLQYGEATRLELYRTEVVHADAALSKRLGLAEGSAVVHMLGLRHRRDRGPPLAHSEIFVPKPRGRRGELLADPAEAVFALMEILNVRRLARVEQALEAENLEEARARRLEVEPGTAALRIERRYFGPRDELLAFAISTHPKDRFTYSTVLTRGSH
jgi:GntR family transcriptional regulator